MLSLDQLQALQAHTATVYVDRLVAEYAVALCDATRHPPPTSSRPRRLHRLRASPRGSINLVAAARALAVLRGRSYALPQDVQELARDVLRHRLVLTYQALAEQVTPDSLLTAVLAAIPTPHRPRQRTTRMSFRWPELLWAVLLVPLVLLVWMRGERRRGQRAVVFGNPALLPNMVTARPAGGGWSRSSSTCWRPPCSCWPWPGPRPPPRCRATRPPSCWSWTPRSRCSAPTCRRPASRRPRRPTPSSRRSPTGSRWGWPRSPAPPASRRPTTDREVIRNARATPRSARAPPSATP